MMQFFLYEIVARVIAIYLLIDTGRALWYGLAERKTAVANYMFMDAFVRLPDWSADRDSAPFQYWFLIIGQVFGLLVCLVIAIFGWYVPKT